MLDGYAANKLKQKESIRRPMKPSHFGVLVCIWNLFDTSFSNDSDCCEQFDQYPRSDRSQTRKTCSRIPNQSLLTVLVFNKV